MSSNFSANQYETAFSPQRLQNYQMPAKYKEHPTVRTGRTSIISNDRGHLNTDVKRSMVSPWGTYVGTWQVERKPIQLKTKTRLLMPVHISSDVAKPESNHNTRRSSAGSHTSSVSVNDRAPASSENKPKSAAHSKPSTADSVIKSGVVSASRPSTAPMCSSLASRQTLPPSGTSSQRSSRLQSASSVQSSRVYTPNSESPAPSVSLRSVSVASNPPSATPSVSSPLPFSRASLQPDCQPESHVVASVTPISRPSTFQSRITTPGSQVVVDVKQTEEMQSDQ